MPDAPVTPSASAVPAEEEPLIRVTGTVADEAGQSLTITLTSTSVREPTDEDRDDFAATRCGPSGVSPFGGDDTRVVTFEVEAVPSPGFTGWEDGRGAQVIGTLFSGTMWEPEAHGGGSDECYRDSIISRPGSAEMRLIVSSTGSGNVEIPEGDAVITLSSYGFSAQVVDALGRATGINEADCQMNFSPAYLELARTIVPFEEPLVPQPGYCSWGSRSYGEG